MRRPALPMLAAAAGLLLAAAALPVLAADGHSWRSYMLNCSGCHAPDGSGQPGSGVPSFLGNVGKFTQSAAGRTFLIQVPGTSQSALSDAEVAELLNWLVRTMDSQHLPQPFTPYTEAEVTRTRTPPLNDVMTHRAAVVKALNAQGVSVR